MDEKLYYYSLIIEKFLDEENLSVNELHLLDEAKSYFDEKSKQNMGIGILTAGYIFVHKGQDVWVEYEKIKNFINNYIHHFAKKRGKSIEDFDLEFINYGRTQLVYVLTDKITGKNFTILAKQPIVEYGKVKQEAKNLVALKKVDDCVVAPIDYYTDGEQELFVTPYIPQARCIASDIKWGMYVPEPYYRFDNFTDQQEHIVNTCMIAKLVSLFDLKNNLGIADCKLGGGDFMLKKGWEQEELTIENTIKSLYLISARKLLRCSFEDYLRIIKDEFSRKTINEEQDKLLVNIRGRVPMRVEDIDNGIKLGKQIIAQRQENTKNT